MFATHPGEPPERILFLQALGLQQAWHLRAMRLALNISSEREPTCRFGNFHVFPIRRSAMRRAFFALPVIFLAPTAAMVLPAAGDSELGAARNAVQQRQIAPGGIVGSDQGDLEGKVILAKGDRTGTGPGAGGQKGQKKGSGNSGGKGKQKGKK